MIIRKSCRKLEKEIVVPPLGRMNTNVKCGGGLRGGSVVRSVALNVNMAMSSTIDYRAEFPEICKVFITNKSI